MPDAFGTFRDAPAWSLTFVPRGSSVETPLADGSVALDVGNGKPEEGIFDHHHLPGGIGSAAALVYAHREALVGRLAGQDHVELIVHQAPDLDCLVSVFVAWALRMKSEWLERDGIHDSVGGLIGFASRADQGTVRPGRRLTLYTFMLIAGRWLQGQEGRAYQENQADVVAGLYRDLRIRYPETNVVDSHAVALGLHLIRHLITEKRDLVRPIQTGRADAALQPVLEGIEELLGRQLALCEQDIARALENGWTGTMQVPDQEGAPFVRVLDPEANPGILGKYLRTWAARELGRPVVGILQFSADRRTVVSVDPASGYTLKGLAVHLERLEQRRRKEQGLTDEGPPRFTCTDAEGRVCADPLLSSSDPWYDGRGHGYTIVDAPRSGSVLTLDAVFSEVVGAEWLET